MTQLGHYCSHILTHSSCNLKITHNGEVYRHISTEDKQICTMELHQNMFGRFHKVFIEMPFHTIGISFKDGVPHSMCMRGSLT